MTESTMQKMEMAIAHHEQQIADLSEMVSVQWQQIEVLKKQLALTQDKLRALGSAAADAAIDSTLTVTEIALRDKPPHY